MELKPGYKRTEIGVIPEEWQVATLGNIGECLIGLTYEPRDVKRHGTLVLRSSNIQEGVLSFHDNVYVEAEIPERIRVKDGDILICVRNGSRALIGKCARLDQRVVGQTFGAFMAVFRTSDSAFIFQQFQSALISRQINENIGATINQITNANLNSFKIPLPNNPAERVIIAAALSDVDALLAKLDQLLAKKRDLKQAAMQQLLTGKRRLPGFSGEWEEKKLGDVTDIDPDNLGASTSPDYAFNYISLEDVDFGVLRGYQELVFRLAPSRARRKLKHNDILVSTVRPNLKSHLLFALDSPDWICSTGFTVVRCRQGISHPGFVFSHLFADKISRQIETLLTGSNYPAINSGDVRALAIPFPAFDEQAAIAAVLSDMDAEITVLEARRDKTRALKQGMMQELLTGRIRLV